MQAFVDITVNGELQIVEISETTAYDLREYNYLIQKAGLVPINDKFDYYWIKDKKGTILSFGAIHYKKNVAFFKADYTFPEYRQNGLWQMLFEFRKFICETKPEIKFIEAVCTKMSIGLYSKYDALIVKKFKSDLWHIRIPLQKG